MKRLFGAVAALLLASSAHAAEPIKMIVPFSAGGPVDALARIVASELGPRLQADVVVENLGGAGGLLAIERAAASLSRAVGRGALDHTHWLFPVVADDPEALVVRLRRAGLDASRKTSAIGAVPAPTGRPELDPVHARELMERVVFLPVYPELAPELDGLLAVVE